MCLANSGLYPQSAKSKPTAPVDIVPEDTKALQDLLTACDKAATDCDKANKDKQEVINGQNEALAMQAKELGKLKADGENILKSPWFWGPVGVVLGMVLGIVVARR